ncbi:hypothetical protein DAPPUDRAFT_257793 [Daphnia pulex]|uniref:Uncharacterized protein n=1 Tax=Daphnia pulex TaxID=6669 RepID=E9HE80_DAPPU|nr:hypothetical protein DAPPUDRAFT_257793 [Daphnia pulex]|eukprot:EFX69970.1 hypothetical protein DAPPUDRAFT_257793 [Daphnia pulex]
MDTLQRSKAQVKRHFGTKIREIDTALADETTSEVRLKTLQAQIKQKWETMEKAYTEIQKLVADTNGDAASLSVLDKEMDEREEMQDAWI